MKTKIVPTPKNIRKFMERWDNIVRMETAIFLGHPAVAPLGPVLERELDLKGLKPERLNHMKRLIGRWALKIMKKRGYEKAKVPDPKDPNRLIDRKGAITGNLFESGQIYRKSGGGSAYPGMETATFLGHPAVEPLGPVLEREFDLKRLRPAISRRALKIMKKRGYEKMDPKDSRADIEGNLFESGTCYRKPSSSGQLYQPTRQP